jgi:hypothetical protein
MHPVGFYRNGYVGAVIYEQFRAVLSGQAAQVLRILKQFDRGKILLTQLHRLHPTPQRSFNGAEQGVTGSALVSIRYKVEIKVNVHG